MAQKKTFGEILERGTPLLFDGAMGTELYNRGVFINRCFEDANLSSPHLVTEIHASYLHAGARVLTTNSWGANRYKLARHNLQDRTREINVRAVELARKAGDSDTWVAGSVGPLGVRIEPWGPTSLEEARETFGEQVSALLDGGVDLIILETFADVAELEQAVLAARAINPTIPLIACLVINSDGNTAIGTPIEWAFAGIDKLPVNALGLNCSVGPQPMMAALPKIRQASRKPIIIEPNAGLPRVVEGRNMYLCSPEYMAEFSKNFLREGVQFVGGCCGTTAEHIKSMANAIRHRKAMVAADKAHARIESGDDHEPPPLPTEAANVHRTPAAEKSTFAAKIARGEMVTSVELMPPAGVRTEKIIEQAKALKAAGIDVINIPDGPRASARMDATLSCVMIEQRAGIETVLHYTCRDRNLLGMQSSLLGLHAIGLHNLLIITGDPPKLGTYPNATGVFDIDAIGLTNMVHRLNGGLDLGGRPIGEPTAFSIGVGVNPVATDFDYEMKRFFYKVDAGAEWCITQPVFDVAALMRFLDHIDKNKLRIPVIAGIWPLVSYHNAQFLAHEVPGVSIPASIMERMSRTKTPEDGRKVGVEIARGMVEEIGRAIQGIAVSAPFGRIDTALAVLGKG